MRESNHIMSIRTVVMDTLRDNGLSSYYDSAQPVIKALEDREDQIVTNLTTFAMTKGLSLREAQQALVECGLSIPMEVVREPSEDPRIAHIEKALADITETLNELRRD